MMRIIYILPGFVEAYGGPYYVIKGLAAGLADEGHQVEVWSSDLSSIHGERTNALLLESQRKQWLEKGVTLRRLKYTFHYHWASWSYNGYSCMRQWLTESPTAMTVLHICGYRDGLGLQAAKLALKYGIPFVWEPMGMLKPVGNSFVKKKAFDTLFGGAIRKAHRVVSTSPVEQLEHVELGVQAGQSSVRANALQLLPDWLHEGSPDEWQRRARKVLGLDPSQKIALYLGRITSRKGLQFVSKVLQNVPDIQLFCVGPDEKDGTSDQIAATLGGQFCQVGAVDSIEKWYWFAAADVFALASPYGENFAISALESVAAGTPLLASQAVGFANMMPEGCGAILELQEVVWQTKLQNLPAKIDVELVRKVRADYSMEAIVTAQMKMYTEVLGA